METWGELFWDAWIRFRLWCRSLVRNCWPPRIEAWQVCTVTGVAAIVLTLLSLRQTPGKAAVTNQFDAETGLPQSKQVADAGVAQPRQGNFKKPGTTPAVEPYDQGLNTDLAAPLDDEIILEGPTSEMVDPQDESEFVDIGPTRSPRADLRSAARPGKSAISSDTPSREFAFNDDAVREVPSQQSELDELVSDTELDVPPVALKRGQEEKGQEEWTEDPEPDFQAPRDSRTPLDSVPDPESDAVSPLRKPTNGQRDEDLDLADEIPDFTSQRGRGDNSLPRRDNVLPPQTGRTENTTEFDEEEHPTATQETPLVNQPDVSDGSVSSRFDREPGHYTRRDHEEEELDHLNSKMPVARIKKHQLPPRVPPAKPLVRTKGHYTRFGEDDEDVEEAQDASNDFQAERIDMTLPETSQTAPPAATQSLEPEVEEEVPVLPPLSVPKRDTSRFADDFEPDDVPPVDVPPVTTRRNLPPPPLDEFAEDPIEMNDAAPRGELEFDVDRRPPVIFAPEPEFPLVDSTLAPEPDSRESGERFHGPAQSTDAVDHEADIEEDAFVRGKRKLPIKMKLPAARIVDHEFSEQPEVQGPTVQKEYQGPVHSTEAADHEAHLEEDELGIGKRKPRSVTDLPVSDVNKAQPTNDHEVGTEPTKPTDTEVPAAPKRYFGPVLSTDSVDHEAHIEEDVLVREKRKQPITLDMPIPKRVEYLGPVLSTEATDHETHMEKDSFSGERSPVKDWPIPRTVRPSPKHQTRQPVLSEDAETKSETTNPRRRTIETPVENQGEPDFPSVRIDDEPSDFDLPGELTVPEETVPPPQPVAPTVAPKEPADAEDVEAFDEPRQTTPRASRETTPRNAPRVIRHDEEAMEEPPIESRTFESDEPEVEVATPPVPEFTQPRGPARISIPQRVQQPEDLPFSNRDDQRPDSRPSESTPISPRFEPRAKLVMEITGPRKVPVGTQIVMHFKVKNVGNAVATGIMVSDVLPPGLQHRLSPDLEYTIARLGPGETRETNLTVQCVAPGLITNRAALTADGDLSTEASIQIEATGTSTGAASSGTTNKGEPVRSPITLTHRGPERWLVDSTGQFLITVTNTSGQRLKNVTIIETYPADTNLIHATIGHKLDATNRTVCWTINDFVPGAAYILETELHSQRSGRQTTHVQVRVEGANVAEDRWTAVSYPDRVLP